MDKFIDKKKNAEDKIHKILSDFVEETGVSINYVDFTKEQSTGFIAKEEYKTKILLKSE